MTHPTRFLHNILARPAEDQPRLSYANWLDATGNPLGEFIRVQCHMAREPRMDFERREQELLAHHEDFWAAALTGRVQWCSFRRGFVEEVSLTDHQLVRHADEVFLHAPILDLHLQWTGLCLDRLPALVGIQHTLFLDISSQRLGNEAADRLAHAPLLAQVHGLNLSSNLLDDDGLDALQDSPYLGNLRELYLSDNPITDEGIRQFLLSPIVERLRMLDLRFTKITRDSIEVLTHVLGNKVMY